MAQRIRGKLGTKYPKDRYNQAFRDETNATIPDVQALVVHAAPVVPVAPVAPVAPNIQASKDNLYKKFDALRNHKSKPTVDTGQHPSTILFQQEELEEWEKDHNILKEEARTAHREAKALSIPDAKTTMWFGLGSRYLNHTKHGKIFISGGKKTKKRKKRGKRMKGKRMKGKGRKTKHKKSKTKKTRKKKRKNFSKTKRKQ